MKANSSANSQLFRTITSGRSKIIAAEGQCDCACPGSLDHGFPDPVTGTHVVRNRFLQSIPLDGDYQALFIPSGDSIAVVNSNTIELLDAFKSPAAPEELLLSWHETWRDDLRRAIDDLARLRFLVSPDAPLPRPDPIGKGALVAWLHVTNACNLQCHYCYLRKTSEHMNLRTGRRAIEAVFRSAISHGFSAVKLKYAGGEPTLNFPLIISLQKQAGDLAQRHGIALASVILSNGVNLTDQMIDTMLAYNLHLMISLDGIGLSHDSQRMLADGTGSFQAVSHTANRAIISGLIPDISITVTNRNVSTLPETIDWVLDRGLPFSINFYREIDTSVFRDFRSSEEQMIERMHTAFGVIESKLPHYGLLASILDRANLAMPHSHVCSVGFSYMVIDQHGYISKCQMQIKQSVTSINAADPLVSIRNDTNGIQNPHVDEKQGCRDCQWRYWCAGGCPLAAYRATGRYDVQSPNCNIYQSLYPQAIRLEGLRLLKYANSYAQ